MSSISECDNEENNITSKELIKIPKGTRVKVLDTQNVRRFDKDGIGHEFVTTEDLCEGRVITCPGNTYGTNYEEGDLQILDNVIINEYQIF